MKSLLDSADKMPSSCRKLPAPPPVVMTPVTPRRSPRKHVNSTQHTESVTPKRTCGGYPMSTES